MLAGSLCFGPPLGGFSGNAGDSMSDATSPGASNFIREIVAQDRAAGKHGGRVGTRFPPEPNGYLHIGHAKSICLNFGLALEHGGTCNLRFDDTNPTTESVEYVEAIKEDVRWLGFSWTKELYASDYFERLFDCAVRLTEQGKAYVDSSSPDQIRELRGTLTEPGRPSPFRDRSPADNLDLFRRMREGEFPDGAHVLRAKIDLTSPNINLRDPILYRIRRAHHYRTADRWCIYPTYDYAHPLSDAFEGITHSICTLEFEDHRPLYEWVVRETGMTTVPQQIEFARLNLTSTVMSKRKLLRLVTERHMDGWDDPRLPTIKGLRRRGYTPEAIRAFCEHIGVSKRDSTVEMALLEHFLREDLNKRALRVMGVLHPLRLVVDNYPDGSVEHMEAINNPEDATAGMRRVPFSRVLYIERDDFREDPPKEFYRLGPGREVRLRYGYIVKCVGFTKDPETGMVTEVRCTYDPDTKSGASGASRKVKSTIHWVSAAHAVPAEVRLYEHLLNDVGAGEEEARDFIHALNPNSKQVLTHCQVESSLAHAAPGTRYQFERQGYFCVDKDSAAGSLVFNRTVPLRDAWAKIDKKLAAAR